jgi:hypothetical protein
MKKVLNSIFKLFIKHTLEEQKKELKEKLEKEIATTSSTWVKIRNQSYLDILENADSKTISIIEETINKK